MRSIPDATPPGGEQPSREKRDRLERLLRSRLAPSRQDEPLSYNQRSLWFLHRLAPDSAAYNVPYVFRSLGPLDVDALQRALRALIGRHAILRTTYSATEPVQRVNDVPALEFECTDASAWPEDEVWEACNHDAHRPFDLLNGPVVRTRVYLRGSEPAILLITFHHIAYDLWSMMTLLTELGAFYESEKTGVPPPLPPVAHQYSDFVRWQADMVASDGERLWAYWRQALPRELPVLRLPADRPRPDVQSFVGATHRRPIAEALATGVQALARAERMTIVPVLLSAFQVLLHGLSSQPHLLVGTPFAGRSRPEFENLIGYFLNTLPLRSDAADDPEFLSFLRRTHQALRGALEHQDYPLELLAEKLRPARSAGYAAFFQAMFVFNRPHRLEWQRAGTAAAAPAAHQLHLERVPLDLQIAQFDLSLQVDHIDESLVAVWEYNSDLFDESTIARWAAAFERLLEAVVDHPAARLSELPPLQTGGEPFVGPGTDSETLVATIYAEVLGRDRVSVRDSLLELGGDEFAAAQIASRLAGIAGPGLGVAAVLEAGTVERLAARLEEILLDTADPSLTEAPDRQSDDL